MDKTRTIRTTRRFPAEVSTPRAARQFVSAVLDGAAGEQSAVALLLTSELVTNAVVHAGTDLDVSVEVRPDRLRVGVRDGDATLPRARTVGPDAVSGRGLRLVESLAWSWGADRGADGGKVVWFTLPHDPSSR